MFRVLRHTSNLQVSNIAPDTTQKSLEDFFTYAPIIPSAVDSIDTLFFMQFLWKVRTMVWYVRSPADLILVQDLLDRVQRECDAEVGRHSL